MKAKIFHQISRQLSSSSKPKVLYSKELKGAYWISSNCDFFQYCDSNIGL